VLRPFVFRSVSSGVPAVSQLLLTKGDNNHIDDLELYNGLEWLERKHVVGKVRGFLPYVGYVTIAMVRMHVLSVSFWYLLHLSCISFIHHALRSTPLSAQLVGTMADG
jgi:hypothetical protein